MDPDIYMCMCVCMYVYNRCTVQRSKDTEQMWWYLELLASCSVLKRLQGYFTDMDSRGLSSVSNVRDIFVSNKAVRVCL